MSLQEKTGARDLTYSQWHRPESIGRFLGLKNARLLSQIDLDWVLWIEFFKKNNEPVLLVETAIDVGQDWKDFMATLNLAKRANLPSFLVLYKISSQPNPGAPGYRDIESFRVKMLTPLLEPKWRTMSPREWAQLLVEIREKADIRLEKEFKRSTLNIENERRII